MVFEFPFDLIVIPLLNIGTMGIIIFFGPLFTIIFTTLALVLFSKRTAITKYSIVLAGSNVSRFCRLGR